LVREYATQKGLPLRTAQNRRKTGHHDWAEWISSRAASGADGKRALETEAFGGLEQMLARMELSETTAAAMVRRAEVDNDLGALPVLAKHHADCCANLTRVRKDLLALREQEGVVVQWDAVSGIMRRYVVPLKAALNTLPKGMAARVNPTDPGSAEVHLQEWVDRLSDQIRELETIAESTTAPRLNETSS